MIDALPLLLGPEGYQISRSVRLRSSASAYLQRTNATTGTDPLKFTVSGWIKRGSTVELPLLGSATGSNAFDFFGFWTGDILVFRIRNSSSVDLVRLESSAVFRDYSAWYHIVAAYDSANATSTERLKMYVNGVQLTAFGTATYPPLNQGLTGDFLTDMQIGRTNTNSTNQNYGDGYITEVNFIDGQALTPSSFGETDAVTGVWKPKAYAGTYGTNGFYLNFSDNSAATAAAIGKDYSGNGNDWTPNNISVTAGVTYDSMLDVPTQWADGGNGRGNYAVINPLTYAGTLANGNLQLTTFSAYGSNRTGTSTIAAQGDKFYWEVTKTSGTSTELDIGVSSDPNFLAANSSPLIFYNSTGYVRQNGVNLTTSVATYATNDVIGVAVDAVAKTIEFFKNGISQGLYSISFDGPYHALAFDDNGTNACVFTFNFGAGSGFSYTPPTGFKALNTLNLPTPTILKGNQYFDAVTYAGSASQQTITTSLVGLDFAWIKNRSAARSHVLVDTVRGGSPLLTLYSDLTAAEDNSSANYNPTSFTTSGIVLGGAKLGINNAGENFVLWGWKEGATQGFDIVTYTGTGANRTVSHSLGVAPSMIIVKARNLPNSIARSWTVWHSALSATEVIFLNQTSAKQTGATTYWNSTLPTSSVFSLGTEPTVNGATGTVGEYVAYLFSEVAGFSKAFSYTGNGSADGPFIFTGFRPRFIMLKRTDATSNWLMIDTERSTYNQTNQVLLPNSSAAEGTGAGYGAYDFLSNGFKPRNVVANETNVSGGTYIGFAWAEVPFKNSLAR